MTAQRIALGILGPTAVGKTALAMAFADNVPARLISVDSAMVYRGMDIGTAKPTPAELRRYPHALVSVLDPAEVYSAARFLDDARREVAAAFEAGEVPVFVGGTMLYFKALRDGLADLPEASPELRETLRQEADERGLAALHAELTRIDPRAATIIEPQNRQRLLRALEVFRVSGEPISSFWDQPHTGLMAEFDASLAEVALLPPSRAVLHERIASRLQLMLEAGFLEEVADLFARDDLHVDLPSIRSVGYRQFWEYLAGRTDREAAEAAALAATRQLAKRQLTWLRGWRGQTGMTQVVCGPDGAVTAAAGGDASASTELPPVAEGSVETPELLATLLRICNLHGGTP